MPPFFIVGCARSGTTLFRKILNNHSQIAIPLESLFLLDYLKASEYFPVKDLIRLLVHEPQMLEWGINPKPFEFEKCQTISDVVENLHQIYVRKHDKKQWGQKTPRFVRNLDLLKDKFPSARFIHIVRDPRAVANSLIRSEVHRSTAYYAARRWLGDVWAGLAFERAHPQITLRVSYEKLVAHQEMTLRKVADFLEINYESQMLLEAKNTLTEYSQFNIKIHSNLDRPITNQFTTKWVNELSKNEIRIIESICSNLMLELGYERCFPDELKSKAHWGDRVSRIPGLWMQSNQYLRYRQISNIFALA